MTIKDKDAIIGINKALINLFLYSLKTLILFLKNEKSYLYITLFENLNWSRHEIISEISALPILNNKGLELGFELFKRIKWEESSCQVISIKLDS